MPEKTFVPVDLFERGPRKIEWRGDGKFGHHRGIQAEAIPANATAEGESAGVEFRTWGREDGPGILSPTQMRDLAEWLVEKAEEIERDA